MVIIAKHRPALEKLGLSTLEQVKGFQGDLVKDHHGRRDILRIRTVGPDGRDLILYLKRNWKPYKKDGLASLLRHGKPWSNSRQEWENSQKLQRAGLHTAALVACGEQCGLLWEKFSYLITEAARGAQTLQDFLLASPDRSRRRRVLDALAQEIRRMHDAGFATPDLFTRHIFVDAEHEPPQFCFIDMARLDERRAMPQRLRARDLAALNATAPLRQVSPRERIRFLRAYAGKLDKSLVRAIAKRMEHLLQRRKFQDFLAPAESTRCDSSSQKKAVALRVESSLDSAAR